MTVVLSFGLFYLLVNSVLLAVCPEKWGQSRWSCLPKYYRDDSSRTIIKNQIRFIGIAGSITVASMLLKVDLAELGLADAARIVPALGWIIGGVIHLLLPPFLVQSYPTSVQDLLTYDDFYRLLARLFGIVTIILGFAVLLTL